MKLSERLETIYGMVFTCDTVADVGCDHGYLSIALVKDRVAKKAIAMDINEGPLKSARENISQAGLDDQIETRLSDGLDALKPGEADVICICGMGGLLMSRILAKHIDVAKATRSLVLEPQSEYYDLRRMLLDSGFIIDSEDMVCEKNKYYPVIRAIYVPKAAKNCDFSEAFLTYGPKLIEDRNPMLLDYLSQQLNRQKRLLNQFEREGTLAGERSRVRQQEIKKDIDMISEVMDCLRG